MLFIHQCKDCKISSILKIYFDYFVLIGVCSILRHSGFIDYLCNKNNKL